MLWLKNNKINIRLSGGMDFFTNVLRSDILNADLKQGLCSFLAVNYQLPLVLISLLQIDLINVDYLIITLHFLNDVVNNVKSTRKTIVTSLSLAWRVNQLESC